MIKLSADFSSVQIYRLPKYNLKANLKETIQFKGHPRIKDKNYNQISVWRFMSPKKSKYHCITLYIEANTQENKSSELALIDLKLFWIE